MEKETHLRIRRERDRKRKEQIRQDQLMISYIKVKYPVQYKEAREYYNALNTAYATRKDLRKTLTFKEFQFVTKSTDNMVLEIPLMPPEANKETLKDEVKETLKHETKETLKHETKETLKHEVKETLNVVDIFPDIDPDTLIEEMPIDLFEGIIKDLQADPDLANLMNDQAMYEKPVDDLDIDIDIQDNLLERELL